MSSVHNSSATAGKASKGTNGQTLSKKEADIFRNILKLCERKEYKKGLKSTETILSKYPEHGETLCIKGLLLNCLDRKEEATKFARKGLLNNLNSHVCWHLYGLIHRSNHNNGEAVKCYLNALKHDPENPQILRDLCILQVHIRDLKGNLETLNKILSLKSNIRSNWMAYAAALHMSGSYDTATKVLDAFYGTLDPNKEVTYEDSELILFRNQNVGKGGKFEEALKHLDESKGKIKDDEGFQMRRAELLLSLQSYEQAEDIYRTLIDIEPENYVVHRLFQCAVLRLQSDIIEDVVKREKACDLPCADLCLDESQLHQLKDTYKELRVAYPKSPAICQILLSMSEGNEFAILLAEFLKDMLSRGVPILGSDLDSLYIFPRSSSFYTSKQKNHSPWHHHHQYLHHLRNHSNFQKEKHSAAVETTTEKIEQPQDQQPKAKILLNTCDEYIDSLRKTKRFPDDDDSSPIQSPEVEMWAMYLKSMVLEKFGRLNESLALAEECISLAPTITEVLQRKARVLKKMGAYSCAADVMESASKLDPSDRYLNNKATKYYLRADRVGDAEMMMGLFTMHEETPQNYLFEMQCCWYELECAESQLRQGNIHLCLKKACAVTKHFEEFVEDQFDFHTYCMRKETLRAYVDMLHMMDNIQGHHTFCRAAVLILKCYLNIFDHPPKQIDVLSPEDHSSTMTSAERKRAKQKAKKEAKRKLLEDQKRSEALKAAAEAAAKQKQQQKQQQQRNDGEDVRGRRAAVKKTRRSNKPVPVDPDPEGFLLAQKDPLTEAAKIVSIIALKSPCNLETWLLGFDVAIRRKKWLMALRALFRCRECSGVDNGGPAVMSRVAQFFYGLSKAADESAATETEFGEYVDVVTSCAKMELLNRLDIPTYTEKFINECMTCLTDRVEAAKCVMLVFRDGHRAAQLITDGLQTGQGLTASAKSCRDALVAMKDLGLSKEDISAFQLKCLELYPLVSAFGAVCNKPEDQVTEATTAN